MLSALLAVCPIVCPPLAERGDALELPWIFADHMVLQRERPIVVWGRGRAGTEVTVTFDGESAASVVDEAGKWRVELAARPASKTGKILTVAAQEAHRFDDVLVGDVWLCAGQSNMDFPLSRSIDGATALASRPSADALRLCDRNGAPGGDKRLLRAEELERLTPERYFDGTWSVPTPEVAARFSAVGFYFGAALQPEIDVPVGLVDVSVGGSTTEGWIPDARLVQESRFAPLVDDYLTTELTHPFIRERVVTQLGERAASRAAQRHFLEPGFLFASAIEPLAPLPLRGVLWYQGESNAHLPQLADRLFRILVEEWRDAFERPDLLFCVVQLPTMGRGTWPEFREVQAGWLDDPRIGLAITLDVGHPTDVHPRRKRPVGERLARTALALEYGRDVPFRGPTLAGTSARGGALVLTFDHAAELAWAPGRGATGFEVAGEDRRFVPAEARLEGLRVVLSASEVARPLYARYAWAPVPEWSLVDEEGLPAAPFRTDG